MRENYPSIYQGCISEYNRWLNINVSTIDVKDLSQDLEAYYLKSTNRPKLFKQIAINYGISVLSNVLASLKRCNEEVYLKIKTHIYLFLEQNSIETTKALFDNICSFEDLLLEGGMGLDSYSLCLHASCVLHKTNQELLSYSLYEWFDLILEGEGISNVFTHRQTIYEWSILDVLPSAVNGGLPKYIFFFNEFILTQDYLIKLATIK